MSKVYYLTAEEREGTDSLAEKAVSLLKKCAFLDAIKESDLLGIKTHFGEKDNTGHINAVIIKQISRFLKKKTGRIFVTDTNTLYKSI